MDLDEPFRLQRVGRFVYNMVMSYLPIYRNAVSGLE